MNKEHIDFLEEKMSFNSLNELVMQNGISRYIYSLLDGEFTFYNSSGYTIVKSDLSSCNGRDEICKNLLSIKETVKHLRTSDDYRPIFNEFKKFGIKYLLCDLVDSTLAFVTDEDKEIYSEAL